MGVQIQLKQTDFVDSKAYSNLRDWSCNSVLTNKDDIVIHAEGGRHCHKKNPSKNEIDYNMIVNKPSINGHILSGDMSSEDLGLCTKENAYADIKRVKDYVYEIYYNELDYDFACDYFAKSRPVEPVGACSAIRNGNFYGRNLDWIYNEDAEFIVRVPRIANRYASMGIAGSISGLTDEIVKILRFVFSGIKFNRLTSNKSLKMLAPLAFSGMALIKTSVIKLAKILPHKLTAIERIKAINEIMSSNLKFFQSVLTKRLIVPFLGLE